MIRILLEEPREKKKGGEKLTGVEEIILGSHKEKYFTF